MGLFLVYCEVCHEGLQKECKSEGVEGVEIIMMLAGIMRMKVVANSVTRILALSSHFCRPQR